jgi:acyl-CoA synthetase (AMP-forming)/AMP-acid ligase II
MDSPPQLFSALAHRATVMPDKIAYRIPDPAGTCGPAGTAGPAGTCGPAREWTYRQLLSRVRVVGRHLRHCCRPGTAVLLAYPPGIDLLAAVLGCAYGQMVAVPVDSLAGLDMIAAECGASVLLSTRAVIASGCGRAKSAPGWPELRVLATDAGSPRSLASLHSDVRLPELAPDATVLLHYQSIPRPTRQPARITHSDLMKAVQRTLATWRIDQQSEVACWLPPRYTPDLLTALLCPLIAGATATILNAAPAEPSAPVEPSAPAEPHAGELHAA